MPWSRALCIGLFITVAAIAAEEKPVEHFEAVAAPQVTLPTAPDAATPPAPGDPNSQAQPPDAKPSPAYWEAHKQELFQAVDQGNGAGNGAATSPTPAQSRSTARSLMQGTMAFCVVIALILVLYYLANRYGKKTPLLAGAGLGQILGRVHLSPKAALYFVRVKNRVLVVGVTANEVSRIAEFDSLMFEQPATVEIKKPAAPAPSAFLKELASRARTVVAENAEPAPPPSVAPPQEAVVDDEIAALRHDLERLQQYLQESTRDTAQ